MSAPGEHAPGEEEEEMDEAGSDGGEEMEEEGDGEEKKIYVPGIEPLQAGEELEMDRSAYRMYHECQTGELMQVNKGARAHFQLALNVFAFLQVLHVWASMWWRMETGKEGGSFLCPCCCARARRPTPLRRTGTGQNKANFIDPQQ